MNERIRIIYIKKHNNDYCLKRSDMSDRFFIRYWETYNQTVLDFCILELKNECGN